MIQKGTDPNCIIFENSTKGDCPQLYYFATFAKMDLKFGGMFELIALPYGAQDLEPVISEKTLGFHHGKHLQAYVDNLNKLLPGQQLCFHIIRAYW